MVIRDLIYPQTKPENQSKELKLAPTGDRMLAFFFDFLIFSPVVSLFGAGLLKQIKTFLMFDQKSPEAFNQWMLFLGVIFLSSWFLQAMFLFFWQATPGQKFLQLKVVVWPHADRELTLSKCLVRSFFWCLGWLFLAVPFIEIFGHPYRRAFHERISDTLVVTLKEGAEAPLEMETRFIASWLNMFFLIIGAFLTASVWSLLSHYQSVAIKEAEPKAPQYLNCGIIEKNWNESSSGLRIDTAVALALTNKEGLTSASNVDCLSKEADRVLWSAHASKLDEQEWLQQKSWAYFAKYLIETDTVQRAAYKDHVCAMDSSTLACELSQKSGAAKDSIFSMTFADLSSLKKIEEFKTGQVLLLSQAVQAQESQKIVDLVAELKGDNLLGDYARRQQVIAVWNVLNKQNERQPASTPEYKAPVKSNSLILDFKKQWGIE